MPNRLHRAAARALAVHAGVRLFRFFQRPLGPSSIVAPAGIALKALDEDLVLRHCAARELDLVEDKVRAAFGRGDACAGAFEQDRLVGYCWFAFAPLPHLDGVWVDFARSVVWLYKSLVRQSHRGRGIAPALYRFADAFGPQRGCTKAVICVESHNRPSVAAARSGGYAAAGYAAYRVHGGGVAGWYSRAARENAVRFFVPAGFG